MYNDFFKYYIWDALSWAFQNVYYNKKVKTEYIFIIYL